MAERNPYSREWQQNWWDREQSYEIYYPNKYSPIYPWVNHVVPPTYPWTVEDFPNNLYHIGMNYKITNQDQTERIRNLFPGDSPTLPIPITHLCHCTHNEKAEGIENEGGDYLFKASKKVGRQGSYKYMGIHDAVPIRENETVLPGYLTWWGIYVIWWYENTNDGVRVRQTETALQQRQPDKVYLPPYLQYIENPDQGRDHGNSVYGSHCFTVPLGNLIESYKKSRKDCEGDNDRKIYFKKAGTLRYRHEICYVVLVCMGKDLNENLIYSMEGAGHFQNGGVEQPENNGASQAENGGARQAENANGGAGQPTNDESQVMYFQSNGFIADDGEILNHQQTPSFISEYPIRAIYPTLGDGRFYSWDTLNFAFYYPQDQELSIPREFGLKKNITHDSSSCHLVNCPDINRRR